MGWMEFVLGLLTLILGTGWLFTYRAYRRKADGEAMQSESEGWKGIQDVYQQTINDLKGYCEDIRVDRNHLREDRDFLREENTEMRKKYNLMEDEIMGLKKQLARQGRKLEALTPFLCSVVGCVNRAKVSLSTIKSDDDNETEAENNNNEN